MNIDRDDEYATRYEAAPTIDKRRCHAPGDKCYGCDHYYGKADVCKYALESQPVPVEPDVIREKRSLVELHGLGGSDKEIIKHIDALLSRIQVAQQERDGKWHRCPSCNNDFKQPFLCTTCGAEKLYDATLQSANQRAEQAEAKLAAIRSQPAPVEPEIPTVYYVTIPTGEYASVVTTASLSKWRAYINTMQSALKRAQENVKKWQSLAEGNVKLNTVIQKRADKAESLNRLMRELMKEPTQTMITEAWKVSGTPFVEADIRRIFKAMSAELLKEVEK